MGASYPASCFWQLKVLDYLGCDLIIGAWRSAGCTLSDSRFCQFLSRVIFQATCLLGMDGTNLVRVRETWLGPHRGLKIGQWGPLGGATWQFPERSGCNAKD